MRISTGMIQRLAVESMLDRQADVSKTQLQLSSGRRILNPSDDPAASTQALRISQEVNTAKQQQKNSDMATSRLMVEESVLSAVGSSYQRIRELAISGLNDTQGTENRISIAQEVRQRLDELVGLANSTDGAGEYLFSGFSSKTPAVDDAGAGVYNYQGDQGQRKIQISPTRAIESSDPGSEVFFNIPFSGGGVQNIFRTIYDFATSLENNAPTDTILEDLDTAMGQTLSIRAQVGARMNAIESQKSINEQYTVQLESNLSDLQDLDYAEAVSRLNLQMAGLQASQQSFSKIQNLSLFNFI